VTISLNTMDTGRQTLEKSNSSGGVGYSSLAAKISNEFGILDKLLVAAVSERETLALKQGFAIQTDNLLSLSTNMKNDQGQLDILNGSPRVDTTNAESEAPTINQSTPAAEPSILSAQTRSDKRQIDTLNRLIDASNAAKEQLTRAFATQEIELLSLSENLETIRFLSTRSMDHSQRQTLHAKGLGK